MPDECGLSNGLKPSSGGQMFDTRQLPRLSWNQEWPVDYIPILKHGFEVQMGNSESSELRTPTTDSVGNSSTPEIGS